MMSDDQDRLDAQSREDWRSDVGKAESGLPADLARAHEPHRGREADSPDQIPSLGWKDIAVRVFWSIPANRLLAMAGGVSFFALMAVFPAIAAVVSLYGLFADATTVATHLVLLQGVLPGGVLDLIAGQIALIVSKGAATLGWAFLTSLAIALWSANSGAAALFDALNVIYGEKEKRSLLVFYASTLLLTLGMITFVILALAAVVVTPIVMAFIGWATPGERILALLRWPIMLVVVAAWLAVIYRYGPSRENAKWRWVTWGGVTASGLWLAASMIFSWYVANFDSYNKTYGSLGAGIGFMVWIWLSVVIILLGAQMNAEMEHQTARDSTEGRPKPLGTRGANMADHVGAAQG
jgi:membrane protein